MTELQSGIHWVSWGGRDPHYEFLAGELEIFEDLGRRLKEDIAEAFTTAEIRDGVVNFRQAERFERGATWTYITNDQPFGTLGERIMRGLRRKFSKS